MQVYDIMMLVVLVVAMVLGAWKGFAWQLASLASLVVSYFAALRFSGLLAPYISANEPMNRFVAMLLIYVLTGAVIWLLFRLVAGFIDRLKLKEFDRQMGALLGLAKGGLLCIVITFFVISLAGDPQREQILHSHSGYYIGYVIDRAELIMPPEIHDRVRPYLERLDRQLEHQHVDEQPVDEGSDSRPSPTVEIPAGD
ncbi:MAG: CvpA family protein [Planctomycetales bacterium]|nr:CvpA family protein [Planctomycetales bacterium]NIM10259.1 CvpA family protein [Planctomycetales bacterium]NIN09697.1 CvpA family protein [Planctomycetales bacterium]NIN78817.1 CvpA family protein [Planctomycetales bacterium]NIO35988.1 CvpA family protein [Planctomycetales bacterium]